MVVFSLFRSEAVASENDPLVTSSWEKFKSYFVCLHPKILTSIQSVFRIFGQSDTIRRGNREKFLIHAVKENTAADTTKHHQSTTVSKVYLAAKQALQIEILREEQELKTIAQRVEQSEAWNKCQLASSWKGALKFSCYRAKDLLHDIQALQDISSYAEIASSELWYQRFNPLSYIRPKPVRIITQHYKSYLAELNQQIEEEKQAVCLAIIHLLQAHEISDNWRRDDSIDELLLPLLKTLNIPYAYRRKQPSQKLTAKQYSQLVTYLFTHASQELKQEARSLLAKPQAELSGIDFVAITNYGALPTPKPLANIIMQWKPWYKRMIGQLLLGKQYFNKLYNIESYYQIVLLGKLIKKLKGFVVNHQHIGNLAIYTDYIDELNSMWQLLANERQRVTNLQPKNEGLRARFLKSVITGLDDWSMQLEAAENEIDVLQVELAKCMSEVLAEHPLEEATLKQDVLAIIRNFFESIRVDGSNANLQTLYAQAYKDYLRATNFAIGFVKEVWNGSISRLIKVEEVEWLVNKPKPNVIRRLSERYKLPRVSKSQATIIQDTLDLINGTKYPKDITAFKSALLYLFISEDTPELERDKFYDHLLKNYVLPAITAVYSPAYQFLEAADDNLAKDWLAMQKRKLAFSKQALIKLLNVLPGHEYALDNNQEQAFILDGQTVKPDADLVLTWIENIKRLSNHQNKINDSLTTAINAYLTVFIGSNNTYHNLFIKLSNFRRDPLIASSYGQKRFIYLFENHQFDSLTNENLLKQQALENPVLSSAIQAYLQRYIETKEGWSQSIERVILQFGTKEQHLTHEQQYDDEKLSYIKALISKNIYTLNDTQDFIRELKNGCSRAYPSTEKGKQRLTELLYQLKDMEWDEKVYEIAQAFGDGFVA